MRSFTPLLTLVAGVVAAPCAQAETRDVPSCMRAPEHGMGAGFASPPATADCDLHPDTCRPAGLPAKKKRAHEPVDTDREAGACAH